MSDQEEGDQNAAARQGATLAIIGVNLVVGVALLLSGTSPFFATASQLVAAGAVDAPLVWHGELWRLLTACFLHVGVWHLGLNMWVMWQVGRALEELVGSARTALIYLVSGVFGFACSVMLQPRITTGASGAVFGIVGALIAIAVLVKQQRLGRLLLGALVPFVGATLLLGVLVPMVDNTAHVGGLVVGFLLGYGLHAGDGAFAKEAAGAAPDADRLRRDHRLGLVALASAALLFLVVVAYAARPVVSPRYHVIEGLAALSQGKVEVARDHARRASQLAHDDATTLVMTGRLLQETMGSDALQTRRLLEEALRRFDESDPTDAFNRAVADLNLGGGDDELPYTDARTTWALCQAALDVAAARPAPILKNNCAWLLLKSADARVKDPALALALAKAAVEESGGKEAVILHTLACALADNGDPQEGLALLEKLSVEGKAGALGGVSLDAERGRLARMVSAQRKPAEVQVDAGPAESDAGPKTE